MAFDYSKLSTTLDSLLGKVDLSKTTEEGTSVDLPDGFYLCEVTKAELTESKSGNPMAAFVFTTVEDGKKSMKDEQGYFQLVDAPKTANKRIYQNYVLSNEMQISFFVSDMLKFQDPDTNEPIFDKNEDFKTTKGIINVCDTLQETNMMIYVMVQTTEKTDATGQTVQSKKYNPISWARARKFDLI